VSNPTNCPECRAYYNEIRDELLRVIGPLAAEHGMTEGAVIKMYLLGYHEAGHDLSKL
jgi:hypothetical protein